MAITYPIDLLANFPGWTVTFELMYRQEQSRHASGRTRVKDFGSPIWRASYASRSLSANELDYWRARLDTLENGQKTFTGYSLSRCRPIAHPGSSSLPTGALHTIAADNKSVRVEDLTDITLSVGDLIQIGSNLHRVMEAATAVAGLTPSFEIRPHVWAGTVVTDTVVIDKPSVAMTIEPGSVSTPADPRTGRGSISFSAIEARG